MSARSRGQGVAALVLWAIVVVTSVWALVSGQYPTPVGIGLESVVAVFAAVCLVRALVLVATYRGPEHGPR